jgi:hypothetical protein
MRRFVPSVRELLIFAILAVIFSIIVHQIQPQTMDLGAAGLAVPLFLVAAVLGLRRSPLWTMSAQAEAEADADEADSQD